jgi:hypothetical protein
MNDKSLPLVIFRGNCQSHHLAAIFHGAGLCDSYQCGPDFGFIPSFRGRLTRFVMEDQAMALLKDAKAHGRTAFLAQQMSPMVDFSSEPFASSLVSGVIKFPHLQFNAMAPSNFEGGIFDVKRLKRLYQVDLDAMRVSQRKASSPVDFALLVERVQVKEPLFYATTHPGAILTSALFRVAADQLFPSAPNTIQIVENEIRQGDSMNFMTDHPFPKVARDALGFCWPEQYELYSEMLSATKNSDWAWLKNNDQLLVKHFSNDTQYILSRALYYVNNGQPDDAQKFAERLVAKEPGFTYYWALLMEAGLFRDMAKTKGIIQRAEKNFENSPVQNKFIAILNTRIRNVEAALAERARKEANTKRKAFGMWR